MTSRLLTPWDPFGVARSLRSGIDRLIEDTLIQPANKATLPLHVYAEGDNLIVKAAMPGLKPEEVKVEVEGDVLRILGESKLEQESQESSHHLRDQFCVRLERSVVLPALVDANKAEAVFANGVLTVTLPKTEETQTSQIAIKPAEEAPKAEPEPAAAEPAAAQAPEPVAVETAEAQPVAVETVAVQASEPQPVATETAEAQAAETQAVAVEAVEAQPAETQTVAAPIAEAETVAAAPIEAQMVETPTAEAHKVARRKAKHQKHEAAKVEAEKMA